MEYTRHLIAGLILIMLATPAFSGDVQLVQSGGVYMVPVRINDAVVIPFVLDSGAAEVVIPADVFSVLLRSGTISQSDYKGAGQYTIADGSTVSSDRYVLHKVTVGDHVITDVIANVSSAKSDPLLGQSFLQRLPAWTLDNTRNALVFGGERRRPQAAIPVPTQPAAPAPTKPATARTTGQPDICFENSFMQRITEGENAKINRSKISRLKPIYYGKDNPYTNKCDYDAHFIDGSDQQITVTLKQNDKFSVWYNE
jgi:hypothetical protein